LHELDEVLAKGVPAFADVLEQVEQVILNECETGVQFLVLGSLPGLLGVLVVLQELH
jgi:hypothetical protein